MISCMLLYYIVSTYYNIIVYAVVTHSFLHCSKMGLEIIIWVSSIRVYYKISMVGNVENYMSKNLAH